MTTVDVAMVTHRPDGIRRVASKPLPIIEGVRYIISWQNHEDYPIPSELIRPDIEIHRFDGLGVASNRNNAIEHCAGDVLLMADDDIIYYPEGISALMKVYDENPDVDFVTFRSVREDGPRYPESVTKLSLPLPEGYHCANIDISFRRCTRLRYCPELGLGSRRFHCGEDDALLLTAIHRGLECRFVPVVVSLHDHPSTGSTARPRAGLLRGFGMVIALTYGAGAILRVPLKAWRLCREGRAPFLKALYYLSAGALEAPSLRRRNRPYLW